MVELVRWATIAVRDGESADVTDSVVRRPGRRAPGPALQGLIAFVIYLVVFILACGQALLTHLNQPSVGQPEVDPNFYVWAWRWWAYAVAHGINPLYSYQIGAPAGNNLAWATTSPSVALLVAPLTAAFGPALSFNLTLLLAPPASAWATFIAARRLTGRFWAALPAGAVYAFNVYTLDHEVSGQPNLTVNVMLPLIVYLMVLWWQGALRRRGYVIWMMVAIALEFYTFVEAFAEMSIMLVAGLALGFGLAGHQLRPRVAQLARYTGVAYLGAMVLAAPYLVYALGNYPSTLTRSEPWFSLDLSGLVLPRHDRLLGMNWWAAAAAHDLSATTYLGIPLLVILVLLAVFGWSRRVTRFLVIGFVIVVAFAAGPNLIVDGQQLFPLPWGGMWNFMFLRSAEPIRFFLFGYLAIALALALWLAAVDLGWLARAGRWALAVVAVAAIFADLPTFAEVIVPPPAKHWTPAIPALQPTNAPPAFFSDGLYRRYLTPGEIVVVVSQRGNAGMLFQAETDFYFRIDGGFINASLSQVDALPLPVAAVNDLTPASKLGFESYIQESGVGAIIVERAWSEEWMYNFGQLGLKGVTVGGVTIYDTRSVTAPTDHPKAS
jgi:hypothetical protein